MKRGFTLVELSIVLVIIGLLIGGILVAQSMISTTKVQRLISDLQKYGVAVSNFKLNYKFYPGDFQQLIPPGDGNDSLSGPTCADAPNNTLSGSESFNVFSHLYQVRMLDQQYQQFSPVSCGGTNNDSILDESNAGLFAPYTELSGMAKNEVGHAKYPILSNKAAAATGNFYFNLLLVPVDSIALESKLSSTNDYPTAIGLTNLNGVGKCTTTGSPVSGPCYDTDTSIPIYGSLNYYVSPN